jgi:hypothetical protein
VPLGALRGVDQSRQADLLGRRLPLDVVFKTLASTVGNANVGLLAILLALALNVRGRKVGLLVFWTVVAAILMLGLNAFMPFIIHIRFFLLIWPPLMILIGLGIERLARAGVTPILTLGVWCAAGLWLAFDPAFIPSQPGAENHIPRVPFTAITDVLARQAGADDLVMFHVEPPGKEWLSEQVLDYYLNDYPFRHQQFERLPGLLQNNDYFRQAQAYIGDAAFVWTAIRPDVPGTYHVAEFKRALLGDFAVCGTVIDQPEMPLDLYARIPAETALHFGEGIGVALLKPLSDLGATELPVTLGWRVDASVPENTYSVGVHVTDGAGNLVGQVDYPLPSERAACRYRDIQLGSLPAGEYHLMVTVYNWSTGERLMGEDRQTGETGDSLPLASLRF